MIPVLLTIKGIYSYQDKEQVIDFKHLVESGIFGIFGKVGSGKSSILEAIMFALYGEIERMNKRDNRAYNILNLKSNNFLIDFIFKDKKGDEYRFAVSGKRNGKKFNDVKIIRNAYKKQDNTWLPLEHSNAEKIIGLNYENFRRTVIIPQGKFQEFLQLSDTERTKMMKELFSLHRYDLSGKLAHYEKENQQNLSNVNGQLLQLSDISDEKIEELSKESEQLNKDLIKIQKELSLLQKQNEEFTKNKQLFAQIEQLMQEFKQLNQEKHKFELLENELKEYNYCVHNFKLAVENKKRIKNSQKRLTSDLQNFSLSLNKIKEKLSECENQILVLKPSYENREQLKIQADELEKLLKIRKLEAILLNLRSRIKKGEKTIAQNKKTIEKLLQQKEQIVQRIGELKQEMPDLSLLSKIKEWITVKNHIQTQITDVENDIKNETVQAVGIKKQLRAFFDKDISDEHVFDKKMANRLFNKQIEEKENEKSQLQNKLKDIELKQALADYSNNLHEGEACPVCGSTHHPKKIKADDLAKKIELYNKNLDELDQLLKNFNIDLNAVNELHVKLKVSEQNKLKLEKKLLVLRSELEKQSRKYPAKKKFSENELQKAFNSAEILQNELKKLEKQLQLIEKEQQKELTDKERFIEALKKLNNDLIKHDAEQTTLKKQINKIDIADFEFFNEAQISNKINDLHNKYIQIVNDYEQQIATQIGLQQQIAVLNEKIQSTEKDLHTFTIEYEKVVSDLKNVLEKSEYQKIEKIEKILEKKLDIDKLTKKTQDFNQKYYNTEKQLNILKKQAEGKEYDAEKHKELSDNLKTTKQKNEDLSKKFGAVDSQKKKMIQKLADKKKLEKRLEELLLRAENIAILKNLFKGNGFVNYVSSVYLQNLVNAANERFFKLSEQKLKLELNENNNFEIRDFLNEGKTRSVKTLSGGQTFQASLSLALALADNVQTMSGSKHNFFFLDEGFGMLDKDALDVVFYTLKNLRKENRIVGIISHVEELKQEIESYLIIENNPHTGSQIISSKDT